MKQNKNCKETLEDRIKRVRDEWWERLWLFHLNSCTAHVIGVDTFIVAPQCDSVHYVGRTKTFRMPMRAESEDTIFTAAALFFDKHPKVRYIVVTLTEDKTNEESTKRAKVTDWLE